MKTIVPDYYKSFKCIAGACRHSCCAGWEIDIDPDSLKRYLQDDQMAAHISLEGTPHFRLLPDGRCPYLNDSGLCDLIIAKGEGELCQICADHPRFRNYWTDRIEMGLGLACEEAARIILFAPHRAELVTLEDDGVPQAAGDLPEDEQWLMNLRQSMMDQVQGDGPDARLLEYLIYRHLADALYDGRLEQRIAFIQRCYDDILDLWEASDMSPEAMVESARSYSAEHEYNIKSEIG